MNRTSLIVVPALIACSPAPPRPPPAPPATIVVAPPDASPPSLAAEVVTTAPVDAGEPEPAPDPCRGSSFDLAALPKPCATKRVESIPASVTASLATDQASARSGESIGVTLTLTNSASEAVEIDLRPQCAYLELQAFRGKKRADYINKSCGFGRGCGGAAYHLIVEAGGKLTQRFDYRAVVTKLADDCAKTTTPLAPGRYDLKVDSTESFVLHDALAKLTAPLVVTQ